MAPKRKNKSARAAPFKRRKADPELKLLPSAISRTAPAPPPVQHSRLLSLPAELLAHVLTFVLSSGDGQVVSLRLASERRWRREVSALVDFAWEGHWSTPPHYNSAVRAVQPATKSKLLATLLVCREFYFAGVAAFYGGNIIKFESTAAVAKMTRDLDIDRRRHISRVMIERNFSELDESLGAHDPAPLCDAMAKLPALKEIILDFKMPEKAPAYFWSTLKDHHIDKMRPIFTSSSPAVSMLIKFAVDGEASAAFAKEASREWEKSIKQGI